MGDLGPIELLEDRLGLDPGHHAGLGELPRNRRGSDLVAIEDLFEVVLDDLGAAIHGAEHHPVEVLETEMSTVDHEIERSGQRRLVTGPLTTQDLEDLFTKRFGFSRQCRHLEPPRSGRP